MGMHGDTIQVFNRGETTGKLEFAMATLFEWGLESK